MSVVIYTKPNCPYCDKARAHYQENGIEYTEFDVQNNAGKQKEMLELTGGDLVVPVIVENGEYVQSGWGDPPRG